MPEVTEGKKSIFGGLKNLFIEDIPDAAPAPTVGTTIATPVFSKTADGVIKAKKLLLQALEDDKLDSYDYLKFIAALQDLSGDIPDEKLRMKTVFVTAKVMGVTKEKLIDSTKHYLNILEREAKEFSSVADKQAQARITAGEEKVKSLQAEIATKQEAMKALKEGIETLTKQAGELSVTVGGDKVTLETRRNDFDTAHAAIVQNIKDDVVKFTTYLG